MADFGKVHRISLTEAMHALQDRRGGQQWQIVLREPIRNPEDPMPETCTVVCLALNPQGRLYLADAGSKRAADEWKTRHADTPDSAFELPDFLFPPKGIK